MSKVALVTGGSRGIGFGIAEKLAELRSPDGAVKPEDYRHALREVASRCIFGVDINPMAVELCRVALWLETVDPGKPLGGLDAKQIAAAKVLAWKGYCHVHMFSPADLAKARAEHPGAKIIVHPETPRNVAQYADALGSTSQIIKYVEQAEEGLTVIVGTELNLVKRLAALHKGRVAVYPLRPSACRNMALTTGEKLLFLLENWPEACEVRVEPQLKASAALALKRMLEIS